MQLSVRFATVLAFASLGSAPAIASPGGSGNGHNGGSHGAGAAHGAVGHAAPANHAWGPRPGHGWHGSGGQGWGGASGWRGRGWAGGLYVGAYAPWWWVPAVPFYDSYPAYEMESTPIELAPAEAAAPVSYRFFCPTSSAYYPDVPTCAVPWLRVVAEP